MNLNQPTINRQPDVPFEMQTILGKIPDNLGVPTVTTNKNPDGDLTPEQKLAIADEEIRRKAEANKGGQASGAGSSTTEGGDQTESDEQIQAKLDELAAKDEATLTDEDKAYIEQHVAPEVSEIDAVKNLFVEKYGLADLAEAEFDNNAEGLSILVDNVAPVIANNMLKEYFESVPGLQGLYDHVVGQGRQIETFLLKAQKPAFEMIDLKEISSEMPEAQVKVLTDNQEDVYRMNLSAKGVDEESINTLVDAAKASGTLYSKAVTARDALRATHKQQIAAIEEAELAKIQQAEQQQLAIHKQVESMFAKNDFNGRNLPPADLKLFKDAVMNVDGQGYSLVDYKRAKMTLADRMWIDYLVFKDFKVTGYAKPKEQTKTFQFKRKNDENNSRNGGRLRGANSTINGGHPTNLDIKTLLSNNPLKT